MGKFTLGPEDYSWKNALLWGNFIKHCQKVKEGGWSTRLVHILIASTQIIPIVGQISSIVEKLIVTKVSNSPQKTLAPLDSKRISVDSLVGPVAIIEKLKESVITPETPLKAELEGPPNHLPPIDSSNQLPDEKVGIEPLELQDAGSGTNELFQTYKVKILAKYDVDETGQLITKEGHQAGMTSAQLEKVMDTAKKTLDMGEVSLYREKIGDLEVFVTSSEKGKIKLFGQSKTFKKLGEGNFGSVRLVLNINKAAQAAIKVSFGTSVRELLNEYILLRSEELEGFGIQMRPNAMFRGNYMLGKLYEGSLLSESDHLSRRPILLESKEKLRCAFQILTGLERGHSTGLIFGDRKLENVLVEHGKRYDLADLGGSIKTDHIAELFTRGFPPISMDERYTSIDDLKELVRALQSKDAELCKDILQKMDVLAIGIVLWEVFTGKNFPRKEANYSMQYASRISDMQNARDAENLHLYPDLEALEVKAELAHHSFLSVEMRNVLIAMLSHQIHERPNAIDALTAFKGRLAIDHPTDEKEFMVQEQEEIARVGAKQSKRK